MKTQLLEDIGQSATLTLVPSGKVPNATADNLERDIAQALAAMSHTPRPVFGVWRQKPASEPVLPAAAVQQALPPQPVHEAAEAPVEHTFAVEAPPAEQLQQDPLFDFTVPWSTAPAAELFKPEPGWFDRWGARYLLPGVGMLAAALLILAGLWFYEERKDAGALALVAAEVKAQPQVNNAVQVKPAPPAPPAATPAVPPLVLLKPEPAAPAAAETGQAAQAEPAAPLPKRVRRTEREQVIATAPVVLAEAKREDFGTAAMLKACREHGYQAAQCIKRACSMTKYGFVCRGK